MWWGFIGVLKVSFKEREVWGEDALGILENGKFWNLCSCGRKIYLGEVGGVNKVVVVRE